MELQGYCRPLGRSCSAGLGWPWRPCPTFFVALQVQGRQDLQGKVKVLAAALGFGYGLTALVLGAPPLAVAAFKLIETLVNLGGGSGWSCPRGNSAPAGLPGRLWSLCGWARCLASSK